MAQDFGAAFGLGEVDKNISTIWRWRDPSGRPGDGNRRKSV